MVLEMTNMWDTVLSTQEQQVLNLLDEMRPELLDCLQALIRFDTSNPPGFNERRAQDWIAERVSSLGMSVDLFDVLPGRPDLVAQLTGLGEGRSFLFNGHVDVAELNDPGAWNHPPFGGEIEDGCLYGLGASDMKGAHAGFLLALECIRRAGYRFKGNVIYESVVGEETGEPGTRQCLERGITADFALVGEPSGARAIFVASVGTVNACITVRDSITRHVIQRREMIRAGGQLSAANCIDVIATRIIPGLLQLEQEWGVHKVHPMLDPGQAMINIFHIEGGGNASMVPSECRAYITVVYLPDEHREDVKAEVEDRVRAICASDRWLTQHPPQIEWSPARFPLEFLPMNGSADEPGAALLAQCLRDVSQRSAFVGGRGAVNDAGWFYQAGVPTAVFGPGDRWVIHQPDEHVAVEDLVIYSKTLALFLLRWCGVAEMPQQ